MLDYNNFDEEMLITCDGDDCAEVLEFNGTFTECIEQMKEEGWHSFKDVGEWEHYCPTCWAVWGAQGVFDG